MKLFLSLFQSTIIATVILSGVFVAFFVVIWMETVEIKPGRVVQDGRVYKITVDSAETDKLFGKEWRKK